MSMAMIRQSLSTRDIHRVFEEVRKDLETQKKTNETAMQNLGNKDETRPLNPKINEDPEGDCLCSRCTIL